MIDLKKISNLTAFYCGSDCEEFAKKCNSINEFVANAKAEWLLSIAEEIGKQFIGMFVAVQNQEKYDEIRKKIVLALIDCALLESDRYSDEQLDLLWVAEEWAKGNVHKDDFDGAFSKAYQAWDWCDVRDYHLKKSTLQLYNSSRLIWLVFRNQNHDGLILYIKEVNRKDNVVALGAVADFGAKNFQPTTNANAMHNVELTTKPAIEPNACYSQ